jgi:uncharacterized repeat protein (TIGR03803 family)
MIQFTAAARRMLRAAASTSLPVVALVMTCGAGPSPGSLRAPVRSVVLPEAKTSWTESVLHGFGGVDGGFPYSSLLDVKGTLYGTTTAGGASYPSVIPDSSGGFMGYGAVFSLVPQGSTYNETLLYSFAGAPADGSNPYAGVISDTKGAVYGTTLDGGTNGFGTVFKLTPGGSGYTERILYSFAGYKKGDGSFPYAGLLMDKSGSLYGATQTGGSKVCRGGCGTVFKLTPTASGYSESILYAFLGKNDGEDPYGTLVADSLGALYGTTYAGGSAGFGTVFKLTPSGSGYTERVLYTFSGGTDGSEPVAGVAISKTGVLYGSTYLGGSPVCEGGCGTVFSLTPSGSNYTLATLYNFAAPGDGHLLYGGVVLGKKGAVYGTTYYGGSNCKPTGCGTVFELVPRGSGYVEQTTYSFNGNTDGSFPGGTLMYEKGTLFGTTYSGGGGSCFTDKDTCGAAFAVKT